MLTQEAKYGRVNGVRNPYRPDARSTMESRSAALAAITSSTENYFNDIAAVQQWLAEVPGQASWEESGLPPESFEDVFLLRQIVDTPDARAHAECMLANDLGSRLFNLFSKADGPIYWRSPIEARWFSSSVVGEWRKDGPFYHAVTDRMCTIKPWQCATFTVYCRVLRVARSESHDPQSVT